ALGKNGFKKSPAYEPARNKPAVLTMLIQRCRPAPDDTPEAFAARAASAVAAGQFALDRIAELGLVNPRWVTHVAAAIAWHGYEEAVYWFIAHTHGSWGADADEDDFEDDDDEETPKKPEDKPEDPWQTIVKARTNLTAEQRADGLIDVAWFHKAYAA